MSQAFNSPLGDSELSRAAPAHWGAAVALALALHLGGAAAYWTYAPKPDATPVERDIAIGVNLGPPGGRLDPAPPPPPPKQAADTPPAPNVPTERAADAPPIEYTEAPPSAPSGAALSSAIGPGGGSGAPEPLPVVSQSVLQAYANASAALIQSEIRYPERARQDEAQGLAELDITVGRDRQLISFEMTQSTGNLTLDVAIKDAVRRVRRYPPLPKGYASDRFRFKLRVRFMLYQ